MTITRQTVADKIAAYLHHEIALAQLLDWEIAGQVQALYGLTPEEIKLVEAGSK